MSVTVRRYVNGGWEVDIRVLLPDGTLIRERKKAPATINDGLTVLSMMTRELSAGMNRRRSTPPSSRVSSP
jgi:hypothetical protein